MDDCCRQVISPHRGRRVGQVRVHGKERAPQLALRVQREAVAEAQRHKFNLLRKQMLKKPGDTIFFLGSKG